MSEKFATVDFHVTSECSQSCPYCWGPQGFEQPIDTDTALRIVERVKEIGARRIVFTGGDPLKRPDIGQLIRHAKTIGLEVALSTTGDELRPDFLKTYGAFIDLISLPIDGPSEEVSALTKEQGHFSAVMRSLEWLRDYPQIDVKLCTPVTRHNLNEVPAMVEIAEAYAQRTEARVFYNLFQVFPRAMITVPWDQLLVSDDEFNRLERQLAGQRHIRTNFLSHDTLDRLYIMIFPDGSLVIPSGNQYLTYGQFLAIEDLEQALEHSRFDSTKHLRHSRGWQKVDPSGGATD